MTTKTRPTRRLDPATLVSKHSISLPPALADKARRIGNGVVSAGIKLALDNHKEATQ